MRPGQVGWGVTWALFRGADDFWCIRGDHSVSPRPAGTATLRIEYYGEGCRLVELIPQDCSFGINYAVEAGDKMGFPLNTEVPVAVIARRST